MISIIVQYVNTIWYKYLMRLLSGIIANNIPNWIILFAAVAQTLQYLYNDQANTGLQLIYSRSETIIKYGFLGKELFWIFKSHTISIDRYQKV